MPETEIFRNHFRGDRCRIEQGIFFGNDQAFLTTCEEQTDGSRVLKVTRQTDALALQAARPDGWVEIQASTLYPDGDLLVMAGPGEHEGEGFIALVCLADEGSLADDGLRWLIHLQDSQAFLNVEIRDDVIEAVSGRAAIEYHWRIPLDQPQQMVGQKKAFG